MPHDQKSADKELAGIDAAYRAIKGLKRNEWNRALDYIASRLAEDDRGAHVRAVCRDDYPEPVWWIEGNHKGEDGTYDCREQAADESPKGYMEVIEVNSIAVVSQQFAVTYQIGDDEGEPSGHECQWFDGRAEAEAFIASLKGQEPDTDAQSAT